MLTLDRLLIDFSSQSEMEYKFQGAMAGMFKHGSGSSLTVIIVAVLIAYFLVNTIIYFWRKNDQFARTGKSGGGAIQLLAGVFMLPVYLQIRPKGELGLCFHCGKMMLKETKACYYCGTGVKDWEVVKAAETGKTDLPADGGAGEEAADAEQAEAEQPQNGTSLAHTADFVAGAVLTADAEGNVVSANSAYLELTGAAPESLKGQVLRDLLPDLFPSENQADLRQKIIKALSGRLPFSGMGQVPGKGGGVRVHVALSFIKDSERKTVGIILSLTDMTALLGRSEDDEKRERKIREGLAQVAGILSGQKDDYTAEHQKQVAAFAYAIARQMGLPEKQAQGVYLAGSLHAIGKFSIPDEILEKPGQLAPEEYKVIQKHPHSGYELLEDIPFEQPVAQAVLQHHERLNGSGYPAGLPNKDIIIEAKILAVADTVTAMSRPRPWRKAVELGRVLQELQKNSGVLYDSKAVDAALAILRRKKENG